MFRSSPLMGQHVAWPVIFIPALKGTIMLVAAGLLSRILKHSSAAVRHILWCTALFSLILFLFPANRLALWQIPVLPVGLFSTELAARQVPPADELPRDVQTALPTTLEQSGEPSSAKQLLTETPRSLFDLLWQSVILLWLAGVLLVVGRLLVGMISVQRLVRGATDLTTSSWSVLLHELSQQLQLTRRVRLLRSEESVMPMTCSGLSAVVLLPKEADEWSTDRRRIVLLHELIHVKRKDLLTQTLAQIVGALHWFNPLVWFALRQLRKEQEWACDEQVLAMGIKASDYAGHLLEIGRKFHLGEQLMITTTAMVRPSQLEERLRAILKPAFERGQPGRAKAGSVAVMSAVFISLAGTQLVRGERAAKVPAVTNDVTRVEQMETGLREQKAGVADAAAKESVENNQLARPTPSPPRADQPTTQDTGDHQTGEQIFNSFSVEEQNRLLSNGIGPAYIKEMEAAGYHKLTVAQLIALYSNSVGADYVANLASVGYAGVPPRDLIALRTNGITADVVKSFQAVNYADFKAMNYIAFRSNGVTPSYLKSMRTAGYDKLTPKQIVDMWVAGVTSEFIREARGRGDANLSPEELIELRRRERR